MRRRIIVIIVLAVAVVGVVIAGTIVAVNAFSAPSAPPAALTQPTWTLTKLVVDGQEQPLAPDHPATLHFGADDGQISGTGGCNTFGASYSLHGDKVQFGPARSTLMACVDPVVSEQENHFFQALPRVQTYQIAGTTLTLLGDSGQVQLTFRAN